MVKDFDALIFDLDGTLIESMWVWEAIDLAFVDQYHLQPPDDFYRTIEGMSYRETAAYYKATFPQLPFSVEEIMEVWTSMAKDKYLHEVTLKPGVKAFLRKARKQGLKTGIATSNTLDLVHGTLNSLGIDGYFDSIHSACEVSAGKPSPEIYLLVSKDLGIAPGRCLVFEDVPSGIMAGKRAGMRVCAVEDVSSKDQTPKKRELADYYIEDYTQILQGTYEVL